MKKLFAIIIAFVVFSATANAQTPGDSFDVNHYEIHLDNIDFTNHTLQAQTIVTLTAIEAVSNIELELKTLTVSSVTSSDANVSSFSQDGSMLIINLGSALAAGQTASFTISYGGNTFNESWGGIMWTNGYVCNMGVGFESIPHNLGKAWFPCVDNFTDKATYDIYVTVPTELTAASGGNLVNTVDNGDGTKTVHYNVGQEVATYHVSFAVGDYVEWTDTYNGLERDIPITVYVKPSQINKVEGTFVNLKQIAEYFEQLYGPYPFNRIGYVITSVGCMEHIDNIGITSGVLTGNTSEESYVAHELSHMWFGNKITCARAEEMWLNEGFAQFCGTAYEEAIYGDDVYQSDMDATIANVLRNYDKAEGWLALNNVPLDLTYGNTVYKKGATIVHTLRNYLGKETFNEAMRHYLDKFAYQAVTSEDLRDAITESTGIDMTGFFDTWVFTCGEPHYAVDRFTVAEIGNNFDVTVYTSQKHRHSDHVGNSVILELAFMDQNWNIVTDTIHWDGTHGVTTKTLDFEPIAVFADYYNKYADARIDKNSVITYTGRVTADNFYADIDALTDSSYLHIENHMVGPDHDLNPYQPWITFSTERYYSIFRDDKGTADICGVFQYNQSSDSDIIHTANDSTILLYRTDASQPWQSIDYEFYGNWRLGRFTVDSLMSGDYAIAVYDVSQLGVGENVSEGIKLSLSPNPASDYLNIKLSSKYDNHQIVIINNRGQLTDFFTLSGDELTIPVTDYPSGVYYINLMDDKKNVISTEKLIKK